MLLRTPKNAELYNSYSSKPLKLTDLKSAGYKPVSRIAIACFLHSINFLGNDYIGTQSKSDRLDHVELTKDYATALYLILEMLFLAIKTSL